MIAASIGNPDHFDKNEVLVRRRDGLFASLRLCVRRGGSFCSQRSQALPEGRRQEI